MTFYNGDKAWSAKEKVETVAKIHRIAGYLMLLIGNVTAFTGISAYFGDILGNDNRKVLGPISLATFVFLVALFETIFRLRNRYALGQIPLQSGDKREFTLEEVD